jgi:hypothetical protein
MGTYLAMMDPAVVGQAKPPPKQRKDDGKPQTIEIFLDHVQQTATGGIAALKLVSIDGKYSNKLPLSAASPKGGLLPAGPRRARETGGQELTERPIIGQKARLFFLSPKKGDDSFHQFIVAGLLFNLATGTLADSRFCLACSSSPHVIIQDWKAVRLVADLSARLRSAQPRGRLARTR